MLKEFKEFATKGNIFDMAIGVIIGGAFQKIVTSLVNDIIMPIIAIFTGEVSFDNLTLTICNSSIKYGSFITTIVDFLIIAFSIFIAIKTFSNLNNKAKENIQKLAKNIHNEFDNSNNTDNLEDSEIIENADNLDNPNVSDTSKLCPYCYSEINIHATRCPHCTSIIEISNINNTTQV